MPNKLTKSIVITSMVALLFLHGCSGNNEQTDMSAVDKAQIASVKGEIKQVLSFDDASIFISENQSPFEVSNKYVTEGKYSLRVHYTNKPTWSNIITDKMPVKDWSGFRYLNFDLFLEGDVPAEYGIWIKDIQMHKATTDLTLAPGYNSVTLDLDQLQKSGGLVRNSIKAMCLYKMDKNEITAYLDNMYLSNERPVVPVKQPVRMASKNLIENGGFESTKQPDKIGNPFYGWVGRRWHGPSYLGKGKKAVYAGKASAMLDGRDRCKIGYYTEPIEVTSPTRLKLTAYVQADDLKWSGCHLTVTDYGERPLKGAMVSVPKGTYPWKKVEMTFDVPGRCKYVKVFAQLQAPGRVWIDDVSLTGVDLDAPLGEKITSTGKTLITDPPLVTESPELLAKKKQALIALDSLKNTVKIAKEKGLETLYAEIPIMLANIVFDIRWDRPEHLDLRDGYLDFILQRVKTANDNLKNVMAGKEPNLAVPPHPDYAKLRNKGRYYYDGAEPRIIFSMQYHSKGELTRWFSPRRYGGGISGVGASRFSFKRTPVWEVYQKYPDTHRVYDGGWCGHIIRDQYSAGGSDRCVISLDSPRMLKAIEQSIDMAAERTKKNMKFPPLYLNMGFEYSYVNYDKYSGAKFQKWLERKYGTIAKLNSIWKTGFDSFFSVTMPSYDPQKPETNPAKYYDWGDFNLWRFTDYMKWAQKRIKKHFPDVPTTTGGGSPFGSGFWRQGIDEEGLLDEGISQIILSETGSRAMGVTSCMDLQRSFNNNVPILDPEYHAKANTCFLMFLHGCSLMDYWWWPNNDSNFYESSLPHSHLISLLELETLFKTALGVRRLTKYIAPFPAAKADAAILYSRASLIQRFPLAKGHKTPYSIAIENNYSSMVRLNTPVSFISSKRVQNEGLDNLKLLVVPCSRYVNKDVFAKITDFANKGGTVVITAGSFIADEYSRRMDYLKQYGIEIVEEELPEFMSGKALRGIDQEPGELDFIQGPVAKTKLAKEPKCKMKFNDKTFLGSKFPESIEAAGIIQNLKTSKEWNILARYEGRNNAPAIISRNYGKGKIYYFAAELTVQSSRLVFDRIFSSCGIKRPIRVYAANSDNTLPEGVESRTVKFDDGLLTYLHNETKKRIGLKLEPKGYSVDSIMELTKEKAVKTNTIDLKPLETLILKIKARKE